jgi:hypothetical protein
MSNVVYTYYTEETKHATDKLSTKNVASVFTKDQFCIKINDLLSTYDDDRSSVVVYCGYYSSNIGSHVSDNKKRLVKLIGDRYKFDCNVKSHSRNNHNYLSFRKVYNTSSDGDLNSFLSDDNFIYECILSSLPLFVRKMEAVQATLTESIDDECYICLMDFSDDKNVVNTCCNKKAHSICFKGVLDHTKCRSH